MRNIINLLLSGILITSCQTMTDNEKWLYNAIDVAACQLKQTADELRDSTVMPRSLWTGYDVDFLVSQLERDASTFADSLWVNPPKEKLGTRRNCSIYDWTSGFFPGSLWYAYELTGDDNLKKDAIEYTNRMFPISKYKDNHDIGFMINCSYGNALRLSPNDSIKNVIVETAENLCSRFNVQIGCIRSWDFGHWNYPVIIDNMMNLDLLFNATNITVMFPKRATDATCFDNIMYQNVQLSVNKHAYPDTEVSTIGARFYQMQLVANELDGTLEATKEFEDSFTDPLNDTISGTRYKNCRSDGTSFGINFQLEQICVKIE